MNIILITILIIVSIVLIGISFLIGFSISEERQASIFSSYCENKKPAKIYDTEIVKGYKIFSHEWTCAGTNRDGVRYYKKYTCPGNFEEKGRPQIGKHGMHFCLNAADCFKQYRFDFNNRVAEVIAYGDVEINGTIACTDKLEIVREVPWEEVLEIANEGMSNTGHHNIGTYNSGIYNNGFNNSGDWNIGSRNSGRYNNGYGNTGGYNDGNNNAGYWNVGNSNTGNWNKTNFSTGCFNTEEQNVMLFNKMSDLTHEEWIQSKAYHLLNQMPGYTTEWIPEREMTVDEKENYPNYATVGGYLKKIDNFQKWQEWWNNLSDDEKSIIKSIPNFDADIFYECTGIKTE